MRTHRVPPKTHESPTTQAAVADAAAAFDEDWEQRNRFLANSPITAFLEAHEIAGSPNELTITGVADIRVSLGDLRALVRNLK